MPKRAVQANRYWLFKSEPESYSIDDLVREGTTYWDGVRNYQARNFLRDDVQVGDGVLFYHSNAEPMAIVGSMTVTGEAYVDHTAFDPAHPCHYDPKSKPESPTWVMVDCQIREKFATPVTRDMLRANSQTAGMMVLQKGSRLSIQPVTADEWRAVHQLAGSKP